MRVAVLGVGLIGGSIGLAARARAGAQVCGYDTDPGALRTRSALGAIDAQAADVATAVEGAEVVFVAAPVGALARDGRPRARPLPGRTAWSATWAPPSSRCDDVRQDERFIGGHPLAGAETAGVEHAREDLFDGATWYLTPARGTAGGARMSAAQAARSSRRAPDRDRRRRPTTA